MIYYILGFIGSFFALLEGLTKDNKLSQKGVYIILVLMVLLASLRHEVGTDWFNYEDFYNYHVPPSVEIGYRLINNLSKSVGIPYNFFLFILNSISLVSLLLFLRKNTPLLILGMLIYYSDLFLYLNLSGIRQALALSLTCLSMNYIINRNLYKFIFILLLASCFHLTASLFIIAYFIPRKRLKIKYILQLSILTSALILLLDVMLELIIASGFKNAEYYILFDNKPDNIDNLFLVGLVKRIIPMILLVLFGKKWLNTPNSFLFIHLYLVGLLIYTFTYKISPNIGVRLSAYFTITELIIIPNILYTLKDKVNRIFVLSVIFGIIFYKLYGYSVSEAYVYKSIIN